MPYIDFDKNGRIIAVYENPQYNGHLFTDLIVDDVDKFLVINKIVNDISLTNGYRNKITEQELNIQKRKNITKRQLLIWLFINKNKTEDDILSAISTIQDSSQQYLAKVNYTGTNNFYFGNEFVLVIGQALGLTVDDVKTMFDEAKNL